MIRLKYGQVRQWSDSTAFKMVMVRLSCLNWSWLDLSALESAYIRLFRPNWPLIKPTPDYGPDFSDQIYLSSVHLQTMVQSEVRSTFPSRLCNFGLETHRCALDWVWLEINLGRDLKLGTFSLIHHSMVHCHSMML